MKSTVNMAIVAAALCASSCASVIDKATRPPTFSTPQSARHAPPIPNALAQPVVAAPSDLATAGSLWRSGPESLFGDRRARKLGDIVTILVEIDDEAEIRNRTQRAREGSQELKVPAFFGANSLATRILPDGAGLDPAIDASGKSESSGDGTTKRNEKIALKIAATVVDVFPNGHLVVRGSQEVRVNYELRDLQVTGVIRPEDISRSNVITYEKIADARISYGGRGQITELQRARIGQRVIDFVSPF
jgi:flagellar L-ring protein precursor FlgH